MNPGRNDPCNCGSGKKYKHCCCEGKVAARSPMPSQAEIAPLIALYNAGRYTELESRARLLVDQYPDFGIGWKLLGSALQMQGINALPEFQKTAELMPDDAVVLSSLGAALYDFGQLDDALKSFRRAMKLNPDSAVSHYNLGKILKQLGKLDEAVTSYRKAIKIQPDYAMAYYNLGNALKDLGRLDDAVANYRKVVELKPDFAEAHYNLGHTLKDLGLIDGALASYRHAIKLNPDFVMAHYNLGVVLGELGHPDAAAASYRRALELKPDYIEAYDNMLYLHAFTRNISPELECSLAADWEKIVLNESELTTAHIRSFDYAPSAGRKLRIGIVSAELGQHAVAEFLEPFLEQLDRSRFHVSLFPTTSMRGSRVVRFEGLADEFKSLVGIPDDKAADLIRSDRIDILIDTTSHMRGSRLGIFAHRAAPVQCHYIGYHGTTGLTEMDWFIADEVLLPAACDAHFRENIWRLPRLWIAYRGDSSLPESRWEPSAEGIIWLGSFNNLFKVREETLALWAKVMNAIPESKLFLKDSRSASYVQKRIRRELGRYGISADRVEFAGHVPDWQSHMALYDKLDIALDTIPLNSGTTAFDALWMGVPLIAMEGNWMGARMTNAILKALGKPEWVAQSEAEYVAIVEALARDVEGRKSLRPAQRALMAGSPLCDAEGLTRTLEETFEAMFDLWATKHDIVRNESSASGQNIAR